MQYEGDFSIQAIYGYEGNESELKATIMEAIEQATKQREFDAKVDKLKSSIHTLEQWFLNLDTEKKERRLKLETLNAELAALTSQ